jgi:fermentation-respiration switch protein FrsA (DUF1100 family)
MNGKNAWRAARWVFGLAVLFALPRGVLPWIVFHPRAEIVATPADRRLPFEDVTLTASDGVKIRGWYVPAPTPNARAAPLFLLFFHGNAGNLSHRLDSIEIFHGLGLSVLIIDYRGYGESGGSVSIGGTALDAEAAWRWLTEERRIPPEKIIVFGRSLGGAIAMELPRRVRPGAVILESTFSSLPEMASFVLTGTGFLSPLARLLLGDVWNSAEGARNLTAPALFIHSPDDEVVPYELGKRLYDAAAGRKTFVEIRGGHNEGFLESTAYIPALEAFLYKNKITYKD